MVAGFGRYDNVLKFAKNPADGRTDGRTDRLGIRQNSMHILAPSLTEGQRFHASSNGTQSKTHERVDESTAEQEFPNLDDQGEIQCKMTGFTIQIHQRSE